MSHYLSSMGCGDMNRYSEQQLLNFCVAQQGRFNPDAWSSFDAVAPEQKVCAMLLLAKSRWYGRQQEMQTLVNNWMPQQAGPLSELSKRAGFDAARFVKRLQDQLWSRTEPKR